MIEVKKINIYKNKKHIIDNLSFEIKPGEILGIVGPPNSGKSVIIKTILQLIKPDYGFITWNGDKINSLTLDNIGYIPQNSLLINNWSVWRALLFYGELKNLSRRKILMEWNYWSAKFKISKLRRKRINALKPEDRKKLHYLLILICDPALILLDDPFVGATDVDRKWIVQFLLEITKQNIGVVFTSSDVKEIDAFINKVLIIKNGKLLYYGDTLKFRKKHKKNIISVEAEDLTDQLKSLKKGEFKNFQIIETNKKTTLTIQFADDADCENFFYECKIRDDLIYLEKRWPTFIEGYLNFINKTNV